MNNDKLTIRTEYERDVLLKAMGYHAAEHPEDRWILERMAQEIDNNVCYPWMHSASGFAAMPEKFTLYRRARKLSLPLPRTVPSIRRIR